MPSHPSRTVQPQAQVPLLAQRLAYAAAILLVIGCGLAWRSPEIALSPFAKKYGGDALWALMVYLGFRFLLVRQPRSWSVGMALVFAASVEFAQLYHPPWLDALRSTRLGRLALGSTFNWPDLPAYALGICAGGALDSALRRR